jgi:hypothetical protein
MHCTALYCTSLNSSSKLITTCNAKLPDSATKVIIAVVLHKTILFNGHETNGKSTELNYHLTRASRTANSHLATIEWPATTTFIIVFTRSLHRSVSWTRSIHSIPHHLISLRSVLILSSHLCLSRPGSGLFPFGFPTKNFNAVLLARIRATCPAHLILLGILHSNCT